MTTIAFDGKTLAADRKMSDRYNVQKIFKVPQGWAAGCGDYDSIVEVVNWLVEGSDRNNLPDLVGRNHRGESPADIIIINDKGSVLWLTWPFLRCVKLAEKKVAYGSGGEFALGAMAAGATAKQAVEIACRLDPYTGKGVDAIQIVKD